MKSYIVHAFCHSGLSGIKKGLRLKDRMIEAVLPARLNILD